MGDAHIEHLARFGAGPNRRERWRAAATWAGALACLVLGLDALDLSGAAAFALGEPRTVPSMLGATLLGFAAVAAWHLSEHGPYGENRSVAGGVAASILGLLALKQAMSLNWWVAEWTGLGPSIPIEITAVIFAVALAGLAAILPKRRPVGGLLALAALAWLGAQLTQLLQPAVNPQGWVAADLELAGSALLAGCLLVAIAPGLGVDHGPGPIETARRSAERWMSEVSTLRVAIVLATAIGVLAVLGGLLIVLGEEYPGPVQEASMPLQWFDLNQELTFPAYFSGLLLASVAALAVLVASSPAARSGSPLPWLGMAAIVAFLAFDEIVDVHGRAQRVTELEAQILFAPLLAAAAVVGVILLARVWRRRPVRLLFLSGGAAWAASMAIDPATHPGSPLAFPEEVLEMTGSALLLMALFLIVRSGLAAERSATGARASTHGLEGS